MGDARRIQSQNGLEHERRVNGGIDRGMSAYEQELQPVVWKLRRQHHLAFLPQELESGLTCYGHLLMTHKIDEGAARCRQQPGLRILWQSVSRPSRECCKQRIAEGIFGAGDVARVRGEIRHQPTV